MSTDFLMGGITEDTYIKNLYITVKTINLDSKENKPDRGYVGSQAVSLPWFLRIIKKINKRIDGASGTHLTGLQQARNIIREETTL